MNAITFWTLLKFAIMLKLAFVGAGILMTVLFLLVGVTWKIVDDWWHGNKGN